MGGLGSNPGWCTSLLNIQLSKAMPDLCIQSSNFDVVCIFSPGLRFPQLN